MEISRSLIHGHVSGTEAGCIPAGKYGSEESETEAVRKPLLKRRKFIKLLLDRAEKKGLLCHDGKSPAEYDPDIWKAYSLGIADTVDLRDPDGQLLRSDAARLSHMYMKKILQIPDIPDISEAEVLKDLYDCRVCTNHVAQVFLRGVMPGKDMPGAQGRVFLAFDLGANVDEPEAERIMVRLENMTL